MPLKQSRLILFKYPSYFVHTFHSIFEQTHDGCMVMLKLQSTLTQRWTDGGVCSLHHPEMRYMYPIHVSVHVRMYIHYIYMYYTTVHKKKNKNVNMCTYVTAKYTCTCIYMYTCTCTCTCTCTYYTFCQMCVYMQLNSHDYPRK